MFKEKLEKIVDNSFGIFLQDKDNPIYKNLRDEVVNNTASLIADEINELEKDGELTIGDRHFNQCLKEIKTKLGITDKESE